MIRTELDLFFKGYFFYQAIIEHGKKFTKYSKTVSKRQISSSDERYDKVGFRYRIQ